MAHQLSAPTLSGFPARAHIACAKRESSGKRDCWGSKLVKKAAGCPSQQDTSRPWAGNIRCLVCSIDRSNQVSGS